MSGNVINNVMRGIFLGSDIAGGQPPTDPNTGLPLQDDVCTWVLDSACHEVGGATVDNNVIVASEGAGLGLVGTVGSTLRHNTLIRCGQGEQAAILVTAVQHQTPSGPLSVGNDQTILINNLIVHASVSQRPMVAMIGAGQTPGLSVGAILDRNLYFKLAASGPAAYNAPFYQRNPASSTVSPYFFDDSVGGALGLAAWNALGRDYASILADPQLDANFRPLASSPAIGAALPSAVVVDNDGAVRDSSPDIGAFELGGPRPSLVAPPALRSLREVGPDACPTEEQTRLCSPPDCYMPGWDAVSAGVSMSAALTTCLNNGSMFPAGSEWSRDVSQLPLHPLSSSYMAAYSSTNLHPDWGTSYAGQPWGIPFVLVSGSFPKSQVSFLYDDESDSGPYPLVSCKLQNSSASISRFH